MSAVEKVLWTFYTESYYIRYTKIILVSNLQEQILGFRAESFRCPHCGIYAKQEWYNVARGHLSEEGIGYYEGFLMDIHLSFCSRCGKYTLWADGRMVYPVSSIAPLPVENMPENVKEAFLEGRDVVNASPRAAAALLRIALLKLMIHLGESGKNLDDDIANLVRKGLPKKIRKAVTAVRFIGSDAVRPGEIDSRDNTYAAVALCDLLNMIVEVMISQPKKVSELYGKLPSSKKRTTKKRKKTSHTRRRKRKKKQKKVDECSIFYR